MTKKMLIDAAHPEETRVVVVDGNRIEEFDFEASAKRQIRSNIYLARVTRVEPSLQAAFVEYGGNRHGFLAFNEIHPDYYQIPYEDRVKLLEEERAQHGDADAGDEDGEASARDDDAGGGDDEEENEARSARVQRAAQRRYRIQEVIKRRQILLVQVVKEERGNKGAALTTYLSLAGRYGVLMPNTPRGGGISRKITSAADRKRLRKIMGEMEVPEGMGLIVRTAGAARTKTEIRRDYDYLLRLWETIRERTLTSVAPCLIHEEGNLVKRAIRDLYDKDIEEVLVDGDAAYREAKDFIRMLMPSHAKKVQPYRADIPLYMSHQVEDQLETIFHPTVELKSGGYLVINQTEALVAIDVNSGRATKERNIETTAVKTNLEAAEEACRQFRLRDLAGLIVIDFIDMDEAKNNRAVEKRMRECLKGDRARLQMGKISSFGLMELSRQRRRASLIEGSSTPCPHCEGRGFVRSPASSALHVLRRVEEEALRARAAKIRVRVAPEVALYIFNEKRATLTSIEDRCAMHVTLESAPELTPPAAEVDVLETHAPGEEPMAAAALPDTPAPAAAASSTTEDEAGEDGGRRRRRRRRRGGRRGEDNGDAGSDGLEIIADAEDDEASALPGDHGGDAVASDEEDGDDKPKRGRRRRGRRGGRGRRQNGDATIAADAPEAEIDAAATAEDNAPAPAGLMVVDPEALPASDITAPFPVSSDAPMAAPIAMAEDDAPMAAPLNGAAADDAPMPVDDGETRAPATNGAAHANGSVAGAAETAAAVGDDDDEDEEAGAPLAVAPTTPPEPDPEAEKLRRRWKDRIRFWGGD